MGIALGLGAALTWGLADYFAALASRGVGALRVVLGFHLFALIPLTILVLATDGLDRLTFGELAVFVAVGAVGWVSYLAFYGALAIGPISVLSPIVSGYAAVTVLLAVLIAGDRLSAAQAAAVGITIAGAMLASADLREIVRARLKRRSALGIALALCAMALLGAFVFGVSYYRDRIGWLGSNLSGARFRDRVRGRPRAGRRGRERPDLLRRSRRPTRSRPAVVRWRAVRSRLSGRSRASGGEASCSS